ncbi:MAG: NAD(P)H-hydrate dehydratase [Phycisphaeraceae bacterium]|nr:NAD(P)H-hydrate dehydratase [Phycisphaerales bacterium]MCB9860137.1 NAD(P)H-hydrate dehydratase [Phycisphaeraceae bacterium]
MNHRPSQLPSLPARPTNAHKGTFGTVGVIGGCVGNDEQLRMIGAPVLAATAAARTGCGLVRLIMPEPLLIAGLSLCTSATGLALSPDSLSSREKTLTRAIEDCDALVVGPGIGVNELTTHVVSRVIAQDRTPVVLDADGLNTLATLLGQSTRSNASMVITPHAGEYHRLAAPLNITHDPTDPAQRTDAAQSLAQALSCVVVLKGQHTVVADADRTWTCERGHVCLATGGTGDVLSGIIGSLIAQRMDLYNAARLGVHIHALAGERWAETHNADSGLLATELCDLIPQVMQSLR